MVVGQTTWLKLKEIQAPPRTHRTKSLTPPFHSMPSPRPLLETQNLSPTMTQASTASSHLHALVKTAVVCWWASVTLQLLLAML